MITNEKLQNRFQKYIDLDNQYTYNEDVVFRVVLDKTLGHFRILSRDPNALIPLINAFSEDNKQAFFIKRHGYQPFDKVYAIHPRFGYFKIGLLFDIIAYIKKYYTCNKLSDIIEFGDGVKQFILDYVTPLKAKLIGLKSNEFEVSPIPNKDIVLRDYQVGAIKAIIFNGYGRGLLQLPTGSGKSALIASLILTLQNKILHNDSKALIFVPNRQLVDQFYSDLLNYGIPECDISMISSGTKKEQNLQLSKLDTCKIIISNRDFLRLHLDLLPDNVDILIADEVHTLSDKKSSANTTLSMIPAKIRIGCTGTIPTDDRMKKWNLIGEFGQVYYSKEITNLQENNYLTDIKITLFDIFDTNIDISYNFHLKANTKHITEDLTREISEVFHEERKYIADNIDRLFIDVVKYSIDLDGNTLVLFDTLEFGSVLFNLYNTNKHTNNNVYYIDGSTPINERETIRATLENPPENKTCILIAQASIFSTGLNVKNLTNLVLASATKSEIRTIQSIGRILRKHKNKDYANIIDIRFNYKYSRRHYTSRKELYKEYYNKDTVDEVIKLNV